MPPSLQDPPLAAPPPSASPAAAASAATLRIRIDDLWYDLSTWQHHHPGGPAILQPMHNQDATDAFYSLHSDDAVARLRKLKHLASPINPALDPSPAPLVLSFRRLRADLVHQGFFKSSIPWELLNHSVIVLLAWTGSWAAWNDHPFLASLLIGLCMQQCGWLGHDDMHARGPVHMWLARIFAGVFNAHSPTWWGLKHNTHHVFTNYVGVDPDIANDPIFHLFFPEPHKDHPLRTIQHYYFYILSSALFASWRIQMLYHAITTKNYLELFFIAINMAWLVSLGWVVSIASILIAGFLVGVIVTATHQSEDMIHYDTPIGAQVRSSANHGTLETYDNFQESISATPSTTFSSSVSSSSSPSISTPSSSRSSSKDSSPSVDSNPSKTNNGIKSNGDAHATASASASTSTGLTSGSSTGGGNAVVSSASYSFVEAQFASTRDARCDPIMEWLWGGMQYQLEHHLFPTMPRYKYRLVAPIVERWAKSNGIEYRSDTVWTIWKKNFETLKFYSGQAPFHSQKSS